jgi:hypothetical protein
LGHNHMILFSAGNLQIITNVLSNRSIFEIAYLLPYPQNNTGEINAGASPHHTVYFEGISLCHPAGFA